MIKTKRPRRKIEEIDPSEAVRIVFGLSAGQKALIESAAEMAGSDVGTFVLAHAMRAVGAMTGDLSKEIPSPVILNGKISDRLRELAKRQSITPHALLEQWLIAVG